MDGVLGLVLFGETIDFSFWDIMFSFLLELPLCVFIRGGTDPRISEKFGVFRFGFGFARFVDLVFGSGFGTFRYLDFGYPSSYHSIR